MYHGSETTGGALAATGLFAGPWMPIWLSVALVGGGAAIFLVLAWKRRGNRRG